MIKLTKITKKEEAAFFGKSPAPVFDGAKIEAKIKAEIAEMDQVIKEAREFLKQQGEN